MRRTIAATVFALASASSFAHAQSPSADPDSPAIGELSFTAGSTRVKDAEQQRVERIADWHARNPNALLIVEAYASRGGARSANLRLSQDRTDAVRDALIEAGADRTRMVLIAHPSTAEGDRGTAPRVVIRATGGFTDLVAEQRDADVGEDRRAARRTTARREASAPRGREDLGGGGDAAAAAPAPAPAGNTTVVIVGGAGAQGGGARQARTAGPSLANAGGAGRTSGGAGASAQTGIGIEPTEEGATAAASGGAGFTGGVFGVPGGVTDFDQTGGAATTTTRPTPGAAGVGGALGTIGLGTAGAGGGTTGVGGGGATTGDGRTVGAGTAGAATSGAGAPGAGGGAAAGTGGGGGAAGAGAAGAGGAGR